MESLAPSDAFCTFKYGAISEQMRCFGLRQSYLLQWFCRIVADKIGAGPESIDKFCRDDIQLLAPKVASALPNLRYLEIITVLYLASARAQQCPLSQAPFI